MLMSVRNRLTGDTIPKLMGDRWTITSAVTHTNFPTSKLLVNNLDDYALFYNQRPSGTWIQAEGDIIASTRTIDLAALLNINRELPEYPLVGSFTSNEYRLIIDLYPIASRRRPPVTSVILTNLTGAFGVINDPVDPPVAPLPPSYVSTRLEVTNPALNTMVVASFSNFNLTERKPSGIQWFRVHVADSASSLTPVTLDVQLVYNGSLVAPISVAFWEKTSEGFIGNYQWLASSLPGDTGVVGISIEGLSTGSSAPEIIDVEWIAELGSMIYDPGAVTVSAQVSRYATILRFVLSAARKSNCLPTSSSSNT